MISDLKQINTGENKGTFYFSFFKQHPGRIKDSPLRFFGHSPTRGWLRVSLAGMCRNTLRSASF